MSDLRIQLEAARNDYVAARYPGDLVADLQRRDRRRTMSRMIIGGAVAAAAIAACVLVIVHVRSSTSADAPQTTVALANDPDTDNSDDGMTLSFQSVPSWSDLSAPTSLTPKVETLVPPAWSIVPTSETLSSVKVTDDNSQATTQPKETA